MTKAATNRQIETAQRELNNAVVDATNAWLRSTPGPTWEEEQEWVKRNPSPRSLHQELLNEVRVGLKVKTEDLMVKIKLGEVAPENIYTELKVVLASLAEFKLACLNLDV